MAQKSKKALYIGIGIVAVAIIATIIVYYYTVVKPGLVNEKDKDIDQKINEETAKEVNVGEGSSGVNVAPTDPNKITNATILEWKSPIMKADRVQWVQNYYNRYVRARKAAGKTPDWPIINEDSKFGEDTHKAVFRIMGKHKTSWTEFKAKVEQLTKNLAPKAEIF